MEVVAVPRVSCERSWTNLVHSVDIPRDLATVSVGRSAVKAHQAAGEAVFHRLYAGPEDGSDSRKSVRMGRGEK